MKTIIFLFIFFGIFLLTTQSFSQCTPDLSVTDPEGNGEIFPLELIFKHTQPVNLVLTIIPPPTGTSGGYTADLKRIVLKDIQNKPSWMSYVSNATIVNSGGGSGYEFMVGTKYCVLLTGTPPDGSFVGVDSMAVIVDAYQSPTNLPIGAANQNGGYIKFTVCAATDTTCYPTGIDEMKDVSFSLLKNATTIFSGKTVIGFNSERIKNVELSVFDLLGRNIYTESIVAQNGENKFRFTGEKLRDGAYIYILYDGKTKLSGRLIKASKN